MNPLMQHSHECAKCKATVSHEDPQCAVMKKEILCMACLVLEQTPQHSPSQSEFDPFDDNRT